MSSMDNKPCGCCEGISKLTPVQVANRPGLSSLAYRIGTHAAFLETMKAGLSNMTVETPEEATGSADSAVAGNYPLSRLTSRDPGDPAIALLDAWATVADVLSFYQERIANEGYLRTATERRSVLELARLVGYALRPGVSSSVFLAYTVDENQKEPVEIPAGALVQSISGPGELPQSFETSEKLEARAAWNNLKPRLSRPQTPKTIKNSGDPRVYLKGIATNLKPNDPLLVRFKPRYPQLYRVMEIEPNPAKDWTLVKIRLWKKPKVPPQSEGTVIIPSIPFGELIKGLSLRPILPPVLERYLGESFGTGKLESSVSNAAIQALNIFRPDFGALLPAALAGLQSAPSEIEVFALRVKAAPHGHNAPKKQVLDKGAVVGYEEWPLGGKETICADLYLDKDTTPLAAVYKYQRDGVSAEKILTNDSLKEGHLLDKLNFRLTIEDAEFSLAISRKDNDSQTTFKTKVLTFKTIADDTITFTETIDGGDASKDRQISLNQTLSLPIGRHNLRIAYKSVTERDAPAVLFAASHDLPLPDRQLSFSEESPLYLPDSDKNILRLDAPFDQITPGSWVAIAKDTGEPNIVSVENAASVSTTQYNFPAKVTQLTLDKFWLNREVLLSDIRNTTVFAQSEQLDLAEEPINESISEGASDDKLIELEGLKNDLKSGSWLIVAGERTDIKVEDDSPEMVVNGVHDAEVVMLADATHKFNSELPGDKIHTYLKLANPLQYSYKRNTVTIYSNVVKATHGETRKEVLGSGDASKSLQSFTLKQPPLTYVASPTSAGAESTLKVYVNDIEWHEVDALSGLGSTDRRFITQTDDNGKTSVIFGNGQQGSRLPSGIENVRSVYRNGIGKAGNVKAGQISLLMTRPQGVKEVINPRSASGGADKETRDQARSNAPLAVMALDRLVSVQDYADFARTFAGIGKAAARRLSYQGREILHLTIAGAEDIPIEAGSDLYQNLLKALRDYGDPDLPIQIDSRELLLLAVEAKISILPDYLWDPVITKVRAILLDAFGFSRRELGQDAFLSEIISTIQSVEGIAYVDVDKFGAVPEKKVEVDKVDKRTRRLLIPNEISEEIVKINNIVNTPTRVPVDMADKEDGTLRPAQLALLSPTTLFLNEAK